MTRLQRHVLVGGICFVLGSLLGAQLSTQHATVRLDTLAEHVDALDNLDAGQAVSFDVWATPPKTPAPPVYQVGLAVLTREGEAMTVALDGESRIHLIVCAPNGSVNPCGPEGIRPDEYGAVVRGEAR